METFQFDAEKYGNIARRYVEAQCADTGTWNIRLERIQNGWILRNNGNRTSVYGRDWDDILRNLSILVVGEAPLMPVSAEEAGLIDPDQCVLDLGVAERDSTDLTGLRSYTTLDIASILSQYRIKYAHFPTFAVNQAINGAFNDEGFENYSDYLEVRDRLPEVILQRIHNRLTALPPPGVSGDFQYTGQSNGEGVRIDG